MRSFCLLLCMTASTLATFGPYVQNRPSYYMMGSGASMGGNFGGMSRLIRRTVRQPQFFSSSVVSRVQPASFGRRIIAEVTDSGSSMNAMPMLPSRGQPRTRVRYSMLPGNPSAYGMAGNTGAIQGTSFSYGTGGAMNFPTGAMNFPTGAMNFPTGAMNFPTGAMHFQSGAMNYPATEMSMGASRMIGGQSGMTYGNQIYPQTLQTMGRRF